MCGHVLGLALRHFVRACQQQYTDHCGKVQPVSGCSAYSHAAQESRETHQGYPPTKKGPELYLWPNSS